MKINIFFIIGLLTSVSCLAQFNTIYHGNNNQVNYSISNGKKQTGNVFIDEVKENKISKKDSINKKSEKKKLKKNQTADFNFKDSLNYYIKQEKEDLVKTKKPKQITKEVDYDYSNIDEKSVKQIEYKTLPLIHQENFNNVKQLVYMPLDKIHITSNYGTRIHPIDGTSKHHNGVDFRAKYENVYSVLNGKVLESGYTSANGNYVVVKHENFNTYYLHLDAIIVKKDDLINAGTIIGISGNTGSSTAPHLHFAVKEDGNFIDPIKFLNELIITNNAILTYGNSKQISKR